MQEMREAYLQLLNNHRSIYKRDIYKTFDTSMRILGVVGPRGVGKTTFLLEYLKENYADSPKAMYVSADSLFFSTTTLFAFAQWFVREHAGEFLCIDEIHKYPNWAQELKNMYDTYPNLKIYFSGSSSINLIKEKHDLSRRAILRKMPGFSFREYLEYTHNLVLPQFTLEELTTFDESFLEKQAQIAQVPGLLGYLRQYMKSGYYPFSMDIEYEHEFSEAVLAVVEKVIEGDIASVFTLKTSTLPVFKKLLYFFATTPPSEVRINRLARSLDKDHSDVSSYIDMMKEAGLLRYVVSDRYGHAFIRNAEKVYLSNTTLASVLSRSIGREPDLGALRELFVLCNLQDAKHVVTSHATADFTVEGHVFEIGGKGKGGAQITGVPDSFLVKDNTLYADARTLPLYLFGFLY